MSWLAVTILVVAGADAGSDKDLSPTVLFGRAAQSTVMVLAILENGTSQGSGVVIAPGEVVTNAHVIEGARSIKVQQGEVSWEATVVAADSRVDLAILRVERLKRPVVSLRPSSSVQVGEKVYAIGAPRGLELTLSDGLISSLRKTDAGVVLQTTAAISPGSSGGGLFDTRGRLVGITTFMRAGQSLNFALPTEKIGELRKRQGTPVAIIATAPRVDIATGRPDLLRCTVLQKAVWALFSGGPEMLESRSAEEVWWFSRFSGQVMQQLDADTALDEFTLSDLNRGLQLVAFSNGRMSQVFFTFQDDAVSMTHVQAGQFNREPRLMTQSGPCEAVNASLLDAERSARSKSPTSLVRAKTFLRECERGVATSCDLSAAYLEMLNEPVRAAQFRELGCRARGQCVPDAGPN